MKIFLLILFFLLLPDLILFCKVLSLPVKLNRVCREKGHEILWKNKPIKALFSPSAGFDFSVKTGERIYRVDLVCADRRNREYLFASPEKLVVNRLILTKIIGGRHSFRRMYLHPVVSASKQRRISLSPEKKEGEVKVLLMYPVGRDVAWDSDTGAKRTLGNGDLFFYSYRFFTLSGFLNELNDPGKYLREQKVWERDQI